MAKTCLVESILPKICLCINQNKEMYTDLSHDFCFLTQSLTDCCLYKASILNELQSLLTQACLEEAYSLLWSHTVLRGNLDLSFSRVCLTSLLYRAVIPIRSFAYKRPPATQDSLPSQWFNSVLGNQTNQPTSELVRLESS